MFIIKELIIISAILILASLGLLEISNPYWKNYFQTQSQVAKQKTLAAGNNQNGFSDEFLEFQNLILYKSLDKEKIKSELNSLKDEYERVYLSALLKKRELKFDAAFNQLFSILTKLPKRIDYYEELSFLGKISGNINRISGWLAESKDTTNNYYLYMDALHDYHNGVVSSSITKIKNLVKKGFRSKEIYYQLAYSYRTVGNYDEAFKILPKAVKLCKGNDSFLSKIINFKGTLFYLSGDYEQAEKEYKSSLNAAIRNGNRIEEIKAFANLAIIKDVYGDVYSGRDDFKKAITLAEEIENIELLAFLYSELGVSFTYTNNLVEARKNYEKSFELYENMRNDERLSYLSSNIGSLYLQITNYKLANTYYNRGLKYSGENKLGRILNLTGLADVYSNESNYSKALEYYKQAKAIADSIKDVSSSLKIERGIGALYFNINRPHLSLEILKKAESQADKEKLHFELINLFSNIGTVFSSIDSITQAEIYFQQGLNIAEQTGDLYSSILIKTELAHNYFERKKYLKASEYLSEAQKFAENYNLKQVLGLQDLYWAKIYSAQGEKKKAREKLLNAFWLSVESAEFNNQIEAGYLLAKDFEQSGEIEKAEKWYKLTTDIIEWISFPLSLNQDIHIAHYSGFNEIYNSFIEFYLNKNRDEEAFLLVERSRAKNTKFNMEKLKLLNSLKNEDEINRLIDLQWMITSGLYSNDETDSLKRILSEIEKRIVNLNPEAGTLLKPGILPELNRLKQQLGNDEHLLSAYVGESIVTLFRLNSKELHTLKLNIKRDSLISLIDAVSPIYKTDLESEEIYINEDLFSFNAYAAFKLYKIIFKEILNPIPNESVIVLNFPPELVKLPVELLVTEWVEDASPYLYKNKEYLINKFQFVYTPSASIYFAQKSKTLQTDKHNLLVGDPYIEDAEFAINVRGGLVDSNPTKSINVRLFPLEYSENEIKSIDEAIDNNVILLSQDATETNFKNNAEGSNIVHISSHSFLLKDQPLVLFSPQYDEKDDGFLELGEIVQLNLNSELVVLSSCRSGLGRIDAAEGIIGMQKAFFEAGSKSVLVSLWDVNDKYTSFFMKDFYKHLTEGKSKSEALRQTKINFIKNYSANPYYWSAFILSGNPSSIKMQEASSFTLLYFLGFILLLSLVYFILKIFPRKHSL